MKYLNFFLIFGALGIIGASLLGPRAITWYFTPPIEAYLNCGPATSWAMDKLLIMQLVFFVMFGVIGLISAFKFKKDNNAEKVIQ